MPAAAPLKNNFNSGELSPLMLGRVDFERYASAMRVSKNGFGLLQGPWTRRPGTYFCDEVKDSTKATRTVRFKYSTISSFVLEVGDQYIRFKKNRAPVYYITANVNSITSANPGVVTYTGADPSNGDHVDFNLVGGMTEINGRRFTVSNVNAGANTFELKTVDGSATVDTTGFGGYTAGGNFKAVYELATTYLVADLLQLKFRQSADVMYINHPDYPERKLSRISDASWSIANTVFFDGPYMVQNATTTTLTPSAFAPAAGITLTASAVIGINGNTGFQTSDVGRLIRVKQGAVWGYVQITGRTSTTVVTVTVINTLTTVDPKATWRMGLYSDTTGYPACATFYGDRLYRGGVPAIPERFDGSNVGDYDTMAPSDIAGNVVDSHAVSFRLNSDDVQSIRWMMGTSNGIAMGTLEGEWLVNASTLNEAITPTNVSANQSTSWGSEDIQPVKAGSSVLFVEASSRRVRELNYQYYENQLQAADTTVLAEHITKGAYDPADPNAGDSTVALSGLVEIAYQKKKLPIVWGVRKDGVLVSMVFSKDDKVMGWHRHILGGWSNAGHTAAAIVESCCVIPASDGSYDELWLIVKRYINGRTVRYNEFLTDLWEQGNAQEDSHFVDCGLIYDGAPTSTITGAYHLAGETVQMLSDGANVPDVPINSTGALGLSQAASVVHLGYAYNSDGQCPRFEAGSATGTAQGKLQRSHLVFFRLYESLGLQVGPSFDELIELPFRETSDPMNQPVPLFTGDKTDFTWDGNYTTENYVCWRFASPLPGTVVAIMPQLATQDR